MTWDPGNIRKRFILMTWDPGNIATRPIWVTWEPRYIPIRGPFESILQRGLDLTGLGIFQGSGGAYLPSPVNVYDVSQCSLIWDDVH